MSATPENDPVVTESHTVTETHPSDVPAAESEQAGYPVNPESADGSPAATQSRKATRFDAEGNEVEEADYYCPGCGRRYDYRRECTGTGAVPHPAIDVVSTDELQGEDHTAAPNTE